MVKHFVDPQCSKLYQFRTPTPIGIQSRANGLHIKFTLAYFVLSTVRFHIAPIQNTEHKSANFIEQFETLPIQRAVHTARSEVFPIVTISNCSTLEANPELFSHFANCSNYCSHSKQQLWNSRHCQLSTVPNCVQIRVAHTVLMWHFKLVSVAI